MPHDRWLNIYTVLLVLTKGHDLSGSANAVLAGDRKFPLLPSRSFNTLVRGTPFEFMEKLYGS